MKAPRMHYCGGAYYWRGKGSVAMGSGWTCCISGERAFAIKAAGWQTYDESAVTCPRCLAVMAKRQDPTDAMSAAMGIPRRPAPLPPKERP